MEGAFLMDQIELVDVNRNFRVNKKEVTVIKNANLCVRKGDFVVLLGASGSGKTTLLNLISGLDKPNSGQIIIDGVDIAKLSNNEMACWRGENLGIVFQSYNLMTYMSAVDNVAMPMVFKGVSKKNRINRAISFLRSVGLKDRIYQNVNYLSGGEQQRVTIARALINNPKVLIADEPTGDLDLASATEVMEILYSLYKERKATIIMSTHNPNYAKYADKVIYIQKGIVSCQKGIQDEIS